MDFVVTEKGIGRTTIALPEHRWHGTLTQGGAGCIADELGQAAEESRAHTQSGGVRGRGTSIGLVLADENPLLSSSVLRSVS